MDLSEKAKQRLENLSPRNRAACCKALKEGSYTSIKLQVRVKPMFLIEIYEVIDALSIDDMSSFLRTAAAEYNKASKKTSVI